jgi:AAA+ ATPase superfamily predicted ATPase
MKSPFKFLDAFTLADKDVFFGREEETEALYSTVFKTPLALIYGLSGTGKTSLVQCGLAGRFDGPDWYPFFLRRNDDINRSLADALAKAIPKGEKPRATLPDTVSLLFRYYLRPVYLIFDQFEELFILGNSESG